MKRVIVTIIITLAMAAPAFAGGFNIQHQLGSSTIEGGNSAPIIDIRATNMFNDHVGIMIGGLIAGELRQASTSTAGGIFTAIERNIKHRGVFTGVSIAIKSVTISTGAIHIDIDAQETTSFTDSRALPMVAGVSVVDLSKSLARQFCAINYKEKHSDSITLNVGLMAYEVDNDFVGNLGIGAVWEF